MGNGWIREVQMIRINSSWTWLKKGTRITEWSFTPKPQIVKPIHWMPSPSHFSSYPYDLLLVLSCSSSSLFVFCPSFPPFSTLLTCCPLRSREREIYKQKIPPKGMETSWEHFDWQRGQRIPPVLKSYDGVGQAGFDTSASLTSPGHSAFWNAGLPKPGWLHWRGKVWSAVFLTSGARVLKAKCEAPSRS